MRKYSHGGYDKLSPVVNLMDQVKIGKFIAQLRRMAGLTQEALGEKLGVTNKTVSRWENGNYLPDIETLQLLAREFQVSLPELLAGERLPDSGQEEKPAPSESAFSFEERKAYFKKKWRREHIALFVLLFLILAASILLPFLFHKPWFVGLTPLVAFVEYGYQNNKMMIYVENNLYD